MKEVKEPKPQKTRTPVTSDTHSEFSNFTKKFIIARRHLAGLTQEQLADILCVEFGIIQRIEKNKGSIENFLKVLSYLHSNVNIDLNSLFDESKEPKLLPKQNTDDDFNVMEHAIYA